MRKHNTAGFTLIELVIVIALLGMIMVGITQLLAAVLAGAGKSRSVQTVKESGQFATLSMERTIRRARRVVTCAGGTLTLDVRETSGSVTYTFRLSGTQLLEDVAGVSPTRTNVQLVASDVQVDSFSCVLTPGTGINPSVVKLQLILSKAGAIDYQATAQPFETTVSLRSY